MKVSLVFSLMLAGGIGIAGLLLRDSGAANATANTRLTPWERGIAVHIVEQPDMKAWLWFYEWNMFDAVVSGQHTGGKYRDNEIRVNDSQTSGSVTVSPDLKIEVTAAPDGAELLLTVTNNSDHDWPQLAAIIPCFNPGPEKERNPQFANEDTWFLADEGLTKTIKRQIHFNRNLRKEVDARAVNGSYVWTEKWPKADPDAAAGLLLRRSADKKWIMAITWERFLSVQAHNPWLCMHQSIHVGPLKRGETRTVRGRIYLLKTTPEKLVERFRNDFPEE